MKMTKSLRRWRCPKRVMLIQFTFFILLDFIANIIEKVFLNSIILTNVDFPSKELMGIISGLQSQLIGLQY